MMIAFYIGRLAMCPVYLDSIRYNYTAMLIGYLHCTFSLHSAMMGFLTPSIEEFISSPTVHNGSVASLHTVIKV